jgi:hypothetical protein
LEEVTEGAKEEEDVCYEELRRHRRGGYMITYGTEEVPEEAEA